MNENRLKFIFKNKITIQFYSLMDTKEKVMKREVLIEANYFFWSAAFVPFISIGIESVYFEETDLPFCFTAIHFGIRLTTRKASRRLVSSTVRLKVNSACN